MIAKLSEVLYFILIREVQRNGSYVSYMLIPGIVTLIGYQSSTIKGLWIVIIVAHKYY